MVKYIRYVLILIFLFVYSNSYTSKNNSYKYQNINDTCVRIDRPSKGLDISRYQRLNYCKIDTSIKFIICKASEGSRLIDRKFKTHWENISDTIAKGAYHFFILTFQEKNKQNCF